MLRPLSDELRIIKAYLEVERLRLGEKLRVEIDVSPDALDVPIPVLSIQPLVENAVKHGIAPNIAGGLVRVRISTRSGAIQVTVQDSGPGFGEAPDSTRTGAGVGLDNVARRLDLCFGPEAALRVESDASRHHCLVRHPNRGAAAAFDRGHDVRVLIADDEPIARRVLREHLEVIPDIEITGEATTGPEAVEQIFQGKPDLVLLDMEMPGLDGLSVVRTLRGAGSPQIIFVTAYGQHAVEAFEVGALDYLLKPVREERLRKAIE